MADPFSAAILLKGLYHTLILSIEIDQVPTAIRDCLTLVHTCYADLATLIDLRQEFLHLLDTQPKVLERMDRIIIEARQSLQEVCVLVEKCRPEAHGGRTPVRNRLNWMFVDSSLFKQKEPVVSRQHSAVISELNFLRQLAFTAPPAPGGHGSGGQGGKGGKDPGGTKGQVVKSSYDGQALRDMMGMDDDFGTFPGVPPARTTFASQISNLSIGVATAPPPAYAPAATTTQPTVGGVGNSFNALMAGNAQGLGTNYNPGSSLGGAFQASNQGGMNRSGAMSNSRLGPQQSMMNLRSSTSNTAWPKGKVYLSNELFQAQQQLKQADEQAQAQLQDRMAMGGQQTGGNQAHHHPQTQVPIPGQGQLSMRNRAPAQHASGHLSGGGLGIHQGQTFPGGGANHMAPTGHGLRNAQSMMTMRPTPSQERFQGQSSRQESGVRNAPPATQSPRPSSVATNAGMPRALIGQTQVPISQAMSSRASGQSPQQSAHLHKPLPYPPAGQRASPQPSPARGIPPQAPPNPNQTAQNRRTSFNPPPSHHAAQRGPPRLTPQAGQHPRPPASKTPQPGTQQKRASAPATPQAEPAYTCPPSAMSLPNVHPSPSTPPRPPSAISVDGLGRPTELANHPGPQNRQAPPMMSRVSSNITLDSVMSDTASEVSRLSTPSMGHSMPMPTGPSAISTPELRYQNTAESQQYQHHAASFQARLQQPHQHISPMSTGHSQVSDIHQSHPPPQSLQTIPTHTQQPAHQLPTQVARPIQQSQFPQELPGLPPAAGSDPRASLSLMSSVSSLSSNYALLHLDNPFEAPQKDIPMETIAELPTENYLLSEVWEMEGDVQMPSQAQIHEAPGVELPARPRSN